MRKISIENLGPIDGRFEMDLDKKLTILIGEQATGKSTIARFVAEQIDDCLYIPAGRAIIPLIFKSYDAASRIKIDPLMDGFLLFIDDIRKYFRPKLDALHKYATANAPLETNHTSISKESAKAVCEIIAMT